MNSSTGIVIQARMGSKRLPGKSLIPLYENKSLIELIFTRLSSLSGPYPLILATSVSKDCDPLAERIENLGYPVLRGHEENVLSRFTSAIKEYQLDRVVRICADNPLIAPEAILDLIQSPPIDYLENVSAQSGYPDGLGAEIIMAHHLIDFENQANSEQQEHVTKFIYDYPEKYQRKTLQASKNHFCPQLKLDIDTPKDFEKMKVLLHNLPKGQAPHWSIEEIIHTGKNLM